MQLAEAGDRLEAAHRGVGEEQPLQLAEAGNRLEAAHRGVGEIEPLQLAEAGDRLEVAHRGVVEIELSQLAEAGERLEAAHLGSREIERFQLAEAGDRLEAAHRGVGEIEPLQLAEAGDWLEAADRRSHDIQLSGRLRAARQDRRDRRHGRPEDIVGHLRRRFNNVPRKIEHQWLRTTAGDGHAPLLQRLPRCFLLPQGGERRPVVDREAPGANDQRQPGGYRHAPAEPRCPCLLGRCLERAHRRQPRLVEEPGVEPVADRKVAVGSPLDETGELELGQRQRGGVRNALAVEQPAVDLEALRAVRQPLVEEGQDRREVGVGADPVQPLELAGHGAIDLGIARHRLEGQALAEQHGEVGMAAGPIENPVEQAGRRGRLTAERRLQRREIVERPIEIPQLQRLADIVGRRPPVLDQLVGRRHADQAEGEPPIGRLDRPLVVDAAQRQEEVVGVGELQRAVDLVEKDHDQSLDRLEHDLAKEAHQRLARRQARLLGPERVGHERHPQTPRDLLCQAAEVPLGIVRAAELGEVDIVGADAQPVAQVAPRPHHQGRLAHLPRGQDVDILAARQEVDHPVVCLALDVDMLVRHQRAAGLKLQRFHRGIGIVVQIGHNVWRKNRA